jgi:3-dehydroquinate synthase
MNTASAISAFLTSDQLDVAGDSDLASSLSLRLAEPRCKSLLTSLIGAPAFSGELGREFEEAGAVEGLFACRNLRGALNLPLGRFLSLLAELLAAFRDADNSDAVDPWKHLADSVQAAPELRDQKLIAFLTASLPDEGSRTHYRDLADRLVTEDPHAIYPTSSYRESSGEIASTPDCQTVDAVMSQRTFASFRVVDHALDPAQLTLRDVYQSLGRCVCLVDQNVEAHYGPRIEAYFQHHGIALHKLVYRAMEVDKGIGTVERILGDFRNLAVSRNEPPLIVGGGVLADTSGFACALYHRGTPYVMLSTSIVSGIDAGPSPRTCCDGFGYKNLFGAFHPPILSITDRFFFSTLHEGWLRHGIAEIIKMAIVKNAALFADLEAGGVRLIDTRFGTINCEPDSDISALSQRILGGALQSYIEAEYENAYETHQCRPHAYGHTWSPGFEIPAGLLHGHAVSVGMGFGAFLSFRQGWISDGTMRRIQSLISGVGLSLWHDILRDHALLWQCQRKVIQKRGGNLVAPLPKGEIGQCGYLNDLTEAQLYAALNDYETLCAPYPREGRGIDPHCTDVGLEDPSTVG